jgi:hypothetical protein
MEKKWYNSTISIFIRWVFFFPLAILGGTIGSNILVFLQKWSIGRYLDVDSFIMKYVFSLINGSAFAGLFLYLTILIVPRYKKNIFITSYILFTSFQIWLLYIMSTGEYYRKFNSDTSAQETDIINLCGTLFMCFYVLYEIIKIGGYKALDEIIESI